MEKHGKIPKSSDDSIIARSSNTKEKFFVGHSRFGKGKVGHSGSKTVTITYVKVKWSD